MKKTKLVEGVDSIGLGDESQLSALSSSAIFTKEFAEYQAQWFFEASRDFFGWMGSDEILYTANAQNVKPEFISNGTTTICINPITDFSTSTTSLTIPTGTNIDLVSTTAEVIRTNITPGLLKSSIKLNKLNENWALYRNCGTKNDLLLLSDGVDCSPTIDNYSIQQEMFFKNSSTNWALEFADISQPDLIRLESTSDFILIVNSSAELLNYTIAQLQYGTLSQEIKCYTDKTVSI